MLLIVNFQPFIRGQGSADKGFERLSFHGNDKVVVAINEEWGGPSITGPLSQ